MSHKRGLGKDNPRENRGGGWHTTSGVTPSGNLIPQRQECFIVVSEIPVPAPTVMKWDVPSGEYIALVFLHQDEGFGTPINKVTIP